MDLIRVLTTTKVTLSQIFAVDEVPTDAVGAVTVTVKRLDGTLVTTGSATHPGDAGLYTFELPAQAQLDTLTVDWSGSVAGATVTVRDLVEVVGGFLFDLGRARSTHNWTIAAYPTAKLAEKRTVVEVEAEDIAGCAFVPRFMRAMLDGSGTDELVTPHLDLRAVRAVKLADRAGGTFVDLTADQLAAVAPQPEGVLIRDDGDIWPDGHRNVIVEYEYGLDLPPAPVRDAGIMRLRYIMAQPQTAIPDRAVSFTVQEGGIYRLASPGVRATGWPDIDAAYQRAGHVRTWLA